MKTFREKIKIEYKYDYSFYNHGLARYSDEIIGSISKGGKKIEFFKVETGEKLFEINIEDRLLLGFLKTNREKDENEIITISKVYSDFGGNGYSEDFSLHNNQWEKLSTYNLLTFRMTHIYEMKDKTILISAQNELYVLFYPVENNN